MLGFIVVWLLLSVTVGAFFGLLFTYPLSTVKSRLIVGVPVAMVVGALITAMLIGEITLNEKTWNGGYHTCGGAWRFVNGVHLRNAGNCYYYECEDCGHVIELTQLMQK